MTSIDLNGLICESASNYYHYFLIGLVPEWVTFARSPFRVILVHWQQIWIPSPSPPPSHTRLDSLPSIPSRLIRISQSRSIRFGSTHRCIAVDACHHFLCLSVCVSVCLYVNVCSKRTDEWQNMTHCPTVSGFWSRATRHYRILECGSLHVGKEWTKWGGGREEVTSFASPSDLWWISAARSGRWSSLSKVSCVERKQNNTVDERTSWFYLVLPDTSHFYLLLPLMLFILL